MIHECQNCGRRKEGPIWAGCFTSFTHSWWGGKYVCSGCEWRLRKGLVCKFDFDIKVLRNRLQELSLINGAALDDLAYDIESIYGEGGYRRISRDKEIRKWVKTTKVYTELFSFEERANTDIVDTMTDIWTTVLNGVK